VEENKSRRPTFEVNQDPKLCNQFGTIFFGGPNNITMDIVPIQEKLKNCPVDQSSTYFCKAPTSQNPIGPAKKNVCELPKQNENDQTKWNGNQTPSQTPSTVANESPLNNTMSSTSFESGNKSMAEMKSRSLDTSWDTPYSSDYIYPLFMCGDKTLSSVEVTGHALNTQDQDVTDKESSTVMFNSNVMVDNRNYSGQVNNPVLQC